MSGTENDVVGTESATTNENTVSDNRIVTPGGKNAIKV